MEFEDLQSIWNDQNDEALYTVNRDALYAKIQDKSRSVDTKLNMYERLMFFCNLIVGVILCLDAYRGEEPAYAYVLPMMYIMFSFVTLVLRSTRKQNEGQFELAELTIVGELDKAIWQIEYLIRQSRSMMIWYVGPLIVVITVTLLLNAKPLWALGMLAILVPLSLFGADWEINTWYLPKKVELEALRDELHSGQ